MNARPKSNSIAEDARTAPVAVVSATTCATPPALCAGKDAEKERDADADWLLVVLRVFGAMPI
jgi:hypothetical protein